MKGFKKQLREGIYTALNNNISVEVFDGNANVDTSSNKWVVIGDVVEGSNNNSMDGTFRTNAITHLFICHRQKNFFTHDTVDDIEAEVLEILIPDVDTAGFTVTGFQVVNTVKVGSGYSDEFGKSENLAKIILQIETQLVQI